MNFGEGSNSSGDEAFTGGSMSLEARVSFDPKNKSVVGWDSIWAIIDAEEKDKNDLVAKLNMGIANFVDTRNSQDIAVEEKNVEIPKDHDD